MMKLSNGFIKANNFVFLDKESLSYSHDYSIHFRNLIIWI